MQSFIKWCSFVRQWCYLERPKYITNYNWNCFSCQSLIEHSKNTKTLYNKGGLGAICMTIFIDKNFKNPLYVHVDREILPRELTLGGASVRAMTNYGSYGVHSSV